MAYHDLFKTSNWKLQLKDQTHVEFFCQEAAIPGVTIGTITTGYASMADKRPGDTIDFSDLTLTIICDEDLGSYKEIMKYLNMTHDVLTNEIRVAPEVFDSFLYLTTNKNNVQHTLHFYDMWIETVSDLVLQTITGDDNSISFTVGLKYNFYTFE
jgi:hypothetical protein